MLVDFFAEHDILGLELIFQRLNLTEKPVPEPAVTVWPAVTSITAPTETYLAARIILYSVCDDVEVFHRTIGHQQPVVEVPVMPGAGCPINELSDQRSVLGMDSLKDHLQRRFDRRS